MKSNGKLPQPPCVTQTRRRSPVGLIIADAFTIVLKQVIEEGVQHYRARFHVAEPSEAAHRIILATQAERVFAWLIVPFNPEHDAILTIDMGGGITQIHTLEQFESEPPPASA